MWKQLDPAAAGVLAPNMLPDLMRAKDPPLGFGTKCPDKLTWVQLMKMNAPLDEHGHVTLNACLLGLVRLRLDMKQNMSKGWDKENADLSVMIKRTFPMQNSKMLNSVIPPPTEKFVFTVGHYYAAKIITKRYLLSRAQRRPEEILSAGPELPLGACPTPHRLWTSGFRWILLLPPGL